MIKVAPAFFLICLVMCQTSSSSNSLPDVVVVRLIAEESIDVTAEVADSNEERTQGLMYRETLDEDAGMLFVFDEEDMRYFWMKNTPLPLDIIYISADKKIVSIAEDTTPYSETPISSEQPAQYVLEVNAGFSARHGLNVGQNVEF